MLACFEIAWGTEVAGYEPSMMPHAPALCQLKATAQKTAERFHFMRLLASARRSSSRASESLRSSSDANAAFNQQRSQAIAHVAARSARICSSSALLVAFGKASRSVRRSSRGAARSLAAKAARSDARTS